MKYRIIIYVAVLFLSHNSFSQAVDSSVTALIRQARSYENGTTTQIMNLEKAFALYKTCAEEGNAAAMFKTGFMYEKGKGVEKNGKEALSWYLKALEKKHKEACYRIGYMYKEGLVDGIPDYTKAYEYFCKSADMGYAPGIYYKGYMHYSGLGCKQDYSIAYPLFQKAASKRNANAIRFVGLCLRNGYGTAPNQDSAIYWLKKASQYGNGMCDVEIATQYPENAELAGTIVEKLKAAQAVYKQGNPVNTFTKIEHSVPANKIEGTYEGWLVKYDWSGQHAIKVDKLKINVEYDGNKLTGTWTENDTVAVPVNALLTKHALLFTDMQYEKYDHYYKKKPEKLAFQKASLQLVEQNDTAYLCGSLSLYSVYRNEPAKPMYVALVKTSSGKSTGSIKYANEDGTPLELKAMNAYPNPFTDIINVDFELIKKSSVEVAMFSLDGKKVYTTGSQLLAKGNYNIPVQTQLISPGTYFIKLVMGGKYKTIKVVKMP